MSLFYNPKTKKPQSWVLVFFIMIPFFIILVGYFLGQNVAQNKKIENVAEEKDIFEK